MSELIDEIRDEPGQAIFLVFLIAVLIGLGTFIYTHPKLVEQHLPPEQPTTPKLTCIKYSGIGAWFHGGDFFSDSVVECR